MTELRDEEAKKGRQILCAGQRGLKMTELRDEKAKKVVRFFVPVKLGGPTNLFCPGPPES